MCYSATVLHLIWPLPFVISLANVSCFWPCPGHRYRFCGRDGKSLRRHSTGEVICHLIYIYSPSTTAPVKRPIIAWRSYRFTRPCQTVRRVTDWTPLPSKASWISNRLDWRGVLFEAAIIVRQPQTGCDRRRLSWRWSRHVMTLQAKCLVSAALLTLCLLDTTIDVYNQFYWPIKQLLLGIKWLFKHVKHKYFWMFVLKLNKCE